MTSGDFKHRLAARLESAGVSLSDEALSPLESYYRLLERWNTKINLTSLPLSDPTDQTFDRLFVEPLAAAKYMEDSPVTWFDLGSGGGSPAIPLKIVRPQARLVMVESKARKTAFLREAARVLGLANVYVETARFEQIAAEVPRTAQLVTIRAVRVDDVLWEVSRQLLVKNGQLLLFRSETTPVQAPEDFSVVKLVTLPSAQLIVLRLFHVEQTS